MPTSKRLRQAATLLLVSFLMSTVPAQAAQTKPARTEVGGDVARSLPWAGTLAGYAGDAWVTPAGRAFARVITKRPDPELYQPYKRHPTLAGTCLAAFLPSIAVDGLREYHGW